MLLPPPDSISISGSSAPGQSSKIKGHLGQDKLHILQDHDRCDLLDPHVILRLSPPFLYLRRRRPDGGEESIPGLPDIKYRSITSLELQRILNHPLVRRDGGPADASAQATVPAVAPPPPPPTPPPPVPRPLSPSLPPAPTEPPAKRPPPQAVLLAPSENAPPPRAFAEDLKRLFTIKNPREINEGVFRRLAERLPVPVQDLVLLSLPRVFDDRRFEVLDFNGTEITSVLQLRGEAFYGFYLTHLGPDRVELVYACHGTHLEWGTDKCSVQSAVGAETAEFRATALLGLAQNAANHFVFLVDPAYQTWIKPRENDCAAAYAHFLDLTEWARHRENFPLIWPAE